MKHDKNKPSRLTVALLATLVALLILGLGSVTIFSFYQAITHAVSN